MKIQEISIKKLKPYENNPRNNEQAIEKVAESIGRFGFKVPIVVDSNFVIVTGHTRLKAAQKLDLKKVPVIVADDLTPDQIKAFRLADNKVHEYATWDDDKLFSELMELKVLDFDIETFGFDTSDIDVDDIDEEEKESIIESHQSELVATVEEDDFDTESEVEQLTDPVAKLGDIWQLGNHRLMCGDSTSAIDIEKLVNGNVIDLVFTDPPYGMKKEKDGVLNDNLNYDDLLEFNKKWIPLTFEVLKDVGSWYCWGIDEPLMDIYSQILKPMIKQNKITFRNLITWNKGSGQGQLYEGFRMYPIADEKCLFVMAGVQGFNINKDNYFEGWEPIRKYLADGKKEMGWTNDDIARIIGVTTGRHYFTKSQWEFPTEENYKKFQQHARGEAFKREYEEIKREYEEIKREYYATRAYFNNTHDNMNNVWNFNRLVHGSKERELVSGHATPKPLALCERAIKSSSRESETVLDVFGGSGSTLIACEQLNRNCFMMELDPKYVDVIIKRWETLTDKKAVLVSES